MTMLERWPNGMERKMHLSLLVGARVKIFVRVFGIAFVVFLVGWTEIVRAEDQRNSAAGLVAYSAVDFIEQEREFVGIQIIVVSYNDGQKILWRSAGPFLNAPLLLDVEKTGNTLKVIVPPKNPYAGVWNLSLKGNVMDAAGPEGRKFSLKKITLKLQN